MPDQTPPPMTPEQIREGVAKHAWFQHIDLGHGIVTPGAGWPGYETVLQGAADIYCGMGIEGQSVLDVGAFDGFYSFAAERAGAGRVVACDPFVWTDKFAGGNRIGSFRFARAAIGSKVEQKVMDIAFISTKTLGTFDHVRLSSVVFTIPDPLDALIGLSAMARRVLSMETHIDCKDIGRPVMLYHEGEKHDDPQTGWGVNSLCVHALLKKLGFEAVIEYPSPADSQNRSIFLGFKPGYYQDYLAANADRAKPRFTGS